MRIGFIGSGNIGSTLARLALAQGHDVIMSNSRGPDTLRDLVADLGPRATAASPAEAADQGEIVVVTVPLKAVAQIPVEPLAGKTVIDTDNYYPQRDGRIEALEANRTTVSELLQEHLPSSHVVKAFNNIYFQDLASQGLPGGSPGRRALPIAGDDASAKQTVTRLIDSFGFDVLDAGPLREGHRFQRDEPAYVAPFGLDTLRAALADASGNIGTNPTE